MFIDIIIENLDANLDLDFDTIIDDEDIDEIEEEINDNDLIEESKEDISKLIRPSSRSGNSDNISSPEISSTELTSEMKTAYLDYALSVIISRALPDARDGLKPVQRRILYAMRKAGYDWSKPYKKSAGTVGDTLKNYHPHGNTPVYEAMVRMAQDFSLRLPLVDGQGNFGSMDGDPPAAERYTEARLDYAARFLLHEDDLEAVPYEPNYDNSTTLPSVLPARFPNLLVNGVNGIAVGMATSIAPHNLNETIDAAKALLDDPSLTVEDLMKYIPGPDLPMGGEICGIGGIKQAYTTGQGSFTLRGTYEIEEGTGSQGRGTSIIVNSIPYQVNKAKLIENITILIKEGDIDEISEIRDESNELGVRIVIEVKRGSDANTLLNKLLSKTQLQVNISMNMLAVLDKQPMQMNLKQLLQTFLQFREKVIIQRTLNALAHAREQAHKLWGLALAMTDLDRVIACIRNAQDTAQAEADLQALEWPSDRVDGFLKLLNEDPKMVVNGVYHFSQAQAKAILDLKLHRLTRLEHDKLVGDVNKLSDDIQRALQILHDRPTRVALMKEEFDEVKKLIGTPRRTIISPDKACNLSEADLVEHCLMVVTLSMSGYIKRVPSDNYKLQRRGGKGKSSSNLHSDDVSMLLLTVDNHTTLLFFSNMGQVYSLKVYQLPETSSTALGKALVNLLPLDHASKEKITNITAVENIETFSAEDDTDNNIVFVTETGHVRRNSLAAFSYIPSNGKRAMKDGEIIVSVFLISDEDHLILTSANGKAIRFACNELRVMQTRDSAGVMGMRLGANDKIVSGIKIDANADSNTAILTISEKGYGKRTSIDEYRTAHRAGQGVATMAITKRTGSVLKTLLVTEDDEIMLLTKHGQLVRCSVKDIRMSGRNTQGVILVNLDKDDEVVNATVVQEEYSEEEEVV